MWNIRRANIVGDVYNRPKVCKASRACNVRVVYEHNTKKEGTILNERIMSDKLLMHGSV